MRWLVLFVGIAGAAGCAEDECKAPREECVDDHTIRRCIADRDGHSVRYVWSEQACSEINPFCVTTDVPDRSPGLCTSSPDRTDACAGGDYCTDGVSYQCVDGYAVKYEICPNSCATSGPDCAP